LIVLWGLGRVMMHSVVGVASHSHAVADLRASHVRAVRTLASAPRLVLSVGGRAFPW